MVDSPTSEESGEFSVSEFKEHLNDVHLSSKRNTRGCVFWRPDRADESSGSNNINNFGESIQENIRLALDKTTSCQHIFLNWGAQYVAQFWAPKFTGGWLATLDVFAVGSIDKGSCWYRRRCMNQNYVIDNGAKGEQLGPPERAFRNGHPESTPDLGLYSVKEFPLRDILELSGFIRYYALPVFDSRNECVGVFEVVSSASYFPKFPTLRIALEEAGLSLTYCSRLINDSDIDMDSDSDIDMDSDFLNDQSGRHCPWFPWNKHVHSDHNGINDGMNISNAEQSNIAAANVNEEVITNKTKRSRKETSFHIKLEDLKPHFGKSLQDAARELGVGKSTLKRACRRYGVGRWPGKEQNKRNPTLFLKENAANHFQDRNAETSLSSGTNNPSLDLTAHQNKPHTNTESTQQLAKISCEETDMMTVTAQYKTNTMRFEIRVSSGIEKLTEELGKRLKKLKVDIESVKLKYTDAGDGKWILLACEEDFQRCVKTLTALDETGIQVLVESIDN